MAVGEHGAGLFPALLKHWRSKRGLSQLDLALAADVSNRHVSFLETGRSAPSEQMILRLAAVLDLPLRHINAMLVAAGHSPAYPEDESSALPEEVSTALEMMKSHHDPFPLVVLDRYYNVIDVNAGALALVRALDPDAPRAIESRALNLARFTFDPRVAEGVLANFADVGRELLWRLQREVLADPDDGARRELLEELLQTPFIGEDWRTVDLARPASPTVAVHLRMGGLDLRFVTAVTAFQAPQTVVLDEMRIETWYPLDSATADACRALIAAR